jgi:hypothetical protein
MWCLPCVYACSVRFGNIYQTSDACILMRWHHLRCIRPPASMERLEQVTGLQEIRCAGLRTCGRLYSFPNCGLRVVHVHVWILLSSRSPNESVHSGLGTRAGTPSQYTLNADRPPRANLNAMRISVCLRVWWCTGRRTLAWCRCGSTLTPPRSQQRRRGRGHPGPKGDRMTRRE